MSVTKKKSFVTLTLLAALKKFYDIDTLVNFEIIVLAELILTPFGPHFNATTLSTTTFSTTALSIIIRKCGPQHNDILC